MVKLSKRRTVSELLRQFRYFIYKLLKLFGSSLDFRGASNAKLNSSPTRSLVSMLSVGNSTELSEFL